MKSVSSVDEYIIKNEKWKVGLLLIRELLLETGLEESIKWGGPVYGLGKKNVVGLGAFKNHLAIWFFQGALLKDEKNLLVNAQEGVTKTLRQLRFGSVEEIDIEMVKSYIWEAVENQKVEKEIRPIQGKPVVIPDELRDAFNEDPTIEECFNKFTASKQREFTEFIAEARRDETRIKRTEKSVSLILKGIGLNDKYRK